jgi:biopolymer transport protein ExbD
METEIRFVAAGEQLVKLTASIEDASARRGTAGGARHSKHAEPAVDGADRTEMENRRMRADSCVRPAARRRGFEIIPLIDIIFFLLATFIMVSLSMSKNQGVQRGTSHVRPPRQPLADQQETREGPVTLSVNDKGDDLLQQGQDPPNAQLPLEACRPTSLPRRTPGSSSTATALRTSSNVVMPCSTKCARSASAKVGINTDKR